MIIIPQKSQTKIELTLKPIIWKTWGKFTDKKRQSHLLTNNKILPLLETVKVKVKVNQMMNKI